MMPRQSSHRQYLHRQLTEEREAGNTETVVARQINAVIKRVGIEAFKNIIIAYEPVWAIGTGVTAGVSPLSSATCTFSATISSLSPYRLLRSECPTMTMNPSNADELIACEDIDGGLIGGASLKPHDFLQICKAG
jgi:triosephosphate isomerase